MSALGSRRAAGFTVLEVTVAFAVLSVAMLLAWRILISGQQQLAAAGRQLVDPPVALAIRQLRHDLAAGSAVAGGSALWTGGALEVVRPDGRLVRYRSGGGTLLREVQPAGAAVGSGARPVMHRLRTFRWRRLAADDRPMVQVEVVYWRRDDIATTRRGTAPPRCERRSVVVTLRGGGGRRW